MTQPGPAPSARPALDLPALDSAPSAEGLRQLLRAALPGKGHQKTAGWWEQMDFLLTRSHVDEDGDAYHDGLFLTLWKRWDFWLALPGTEPVQTGHWAARAWARVTRPAARPATGAAGLLGRQRGYDAAGEPEAWAPLPPASQQPSDDDADPASQALRHAWHLLLRYWHAAEHERRGGWPLRTRLHAALSRERVAALIALPVFTERYDDWSDPERSGWWDGDVWLGARQRQASGLALAGGRGAALKLGWRNGTEGPGDPDDDAHASYQLELLGPNAPPAPGTLHPPGLLISYRQRQSAPRAPLPGHAALHAGRLLQLFGPARARLLAGHARDEAARAEALQDLGAPAAAPALARLPPYVAASSDEAVFGAEVMALSRRWQAAARTHAAEVRGRWAGGCGQEPAHAVRDARALHAAEVLQLVRQLNALGDAGALQRLHHRFAFAPVVFAAHAARHGCPVLALHWREDGSLHARVRPAAGNAPAGWRLHWEGPDLARVAPVPEAPDAARPCAAPEISGEPGPAGATAALPGLQLLGDAGGDLRALAPDGHCLWRHHVGGAVTCIAAQPGASGLLAVGTAAGSVVLLRKAAGPDPLHAGTSRLHELRRVLFWAGEAGPLLW